MHATRQMKEGGATRIVGQTFSRHLTHWGSITEFLPFTAEATQLAVRNRNAPLHLYASNCATGVAGRQPGRLRCPAIVGGTKVITILP